MITFYYIVYLNLCNPFEWCGFQIHADLNAARNIAVLGISGNGRLPVSQPYIACDEVEARKGIDTEHSDNASHFKSAE